MNAACLLMRIELMKTQIDLYRTQQRWEVFKALAAILGAAVALMGFTLALAFWLAPHPR
jgi:hypothetical protein